YTFSTLASGRIMGMLAPEKNREQRIRLQLSVWNVGFMRRLRFFSLSIASLATSLLTVMTA
ncbi:hypothetical protein, partial [Pseudomonas syringae]